MKQTLKYLSYICRHKWFVFVECYKRGIIWRGLVHDLSKLGNIEFGAYKRYFYNKDGSARRLEDFHVVKDNNEFDQAWLHHQKHNKHHWQYWVLKEDDGGEIVLPIPHPYRVEMICDWIGAGKAIRGKNDNKARWWYDNNKHKIKLHPETQKWVEKNL